MSLSAPNRISEPGPDEFSGISDFIRTYASALTQMQSQNSLVTDPQATAALEKIKDSLVFAYLVANLNFKNLPLKEFMDGFEKKILLTCLRLTGGNQKNAAAVMSIKPTVLFEKMRKHGIRRQQLHLPGTQRAPFADSNT